MTPTQQKKILKVIAKLDRVYEKELSPIKRKRLIKKYSSLKRRLDK